MFDTESFWDHVYIETCPNSVCNTGKVLIKRLNGIINTLTTFPSYDSVWNSQPESGRSTLQLRFTSDSRTVKKGFSGVWYLPANACSSPTSCVANSYYSFAGTVGCQTCPSNSLSAAGSMAIEACVCNAGFGGANGALCTQCEAGTYESGDVCASCLPYSNSAAQSTSCVCNAGFMPGNAGQCVEIGCSENEYFSDLLGRCENCPAFSTSPSHSTAASACVCNVGHTGADGGPCSACAAGKYKTTTGSVACTLCIPGKFSGGGH